MFPTPRVGEGAKGDHFFLKTSTKGVVNRKETSQNRPRLSQEQATSHRSRFFSQGPISFQEHGNR